jgi:TRAP transporter TAXI family solute receptor
MMASYKNLAGYRILLLFIFPFLTCCGQENKKSDVDVPEKKPSIFTIGTGSAEDLSYAAGAAIAQITNENIEQSSPRMQVRSSDQSPFQRLNSVLSGELEFTVVTSDKLYEASRGKAEWIDMGPQLKLLAAFTICTESVSLIAADDAGIDTIHDLKGKRVFIGNPASRERQFAVHALENAGINVEKDIQNLDVEMFRAQEMLENGLLDAFFYTGVHPDKTINKISEGKRKVHFVPITGVRGLLLKYPYYIQTTIPLELYSGFMNKEPVKTYGCNLALVAYAKVPDKIVHQVTKTTFENISTLNTFHPAFQTLKKENLLDGMFRMIHRGALLYYMENNYRLSCCF